MSEKTGRNEFILKNGRSKKIIDLTNLALDSFPRNVRKSIDKFEEALKEAKLLQTEDENIRKETIVKCIFNLHVANICLYTGNEKGKNIHEKAKKIQDSIEELRNLIPEAKEYDAIIVPDIHFYIGKGHLECKEFDSALRAFKQADVENCELERREWSLREANNDFILELETDERELLKRLKENIHLKLPKESGPENASYFDSMCEVMELTYRYLELQLKQNPEDAKEEASKMIKLDTFLKAARDETKEVGKKKAERKISPTVLCDLGLVYAQLQKYRDARNCFTTARDVSKDSQGSDSRLQIVHNIAATLVLENDFREAVEEYSEFAAVDGTIKAENQDLLLHAYLNWAFCYLRLEQTDVAYKYYTMAFVIALKLDDMQGARKVLEGLIATVLSLEKSVETMERYKLKLGLLDCDDVDREKAESAKGELDDRKERFKEIIGSHKSGIKDTGRRNLSGKSTETVGSKDRQSQKETGKEKKRKTSQESQEKSKRANSSDAPKHTKDEARTKDEKPVDTKGTCSELAKDKKVTADDMQSNTSVSKSTEEVDRKAAKNNENEHSVAENSSSERKKKDTGNKKKELSKTTEQIYKDKKIPKLYAT